MIAIVRARRLMRNCEFRKFGVGSYGEIGDSLDTIIPYFTINSKCISNPISKKIKTTSCISI